MDVGAAGLAPDRGRLWLQWEEALEAAEPESGGSDAGVLRTDAGRYLGFVRMVGRRRERDNESAG
jgi:hypothetical protein